MSDSENAYLTANDLGALVKGFEDCTIPPSEFDHRAHVTVAFGYLYLFHLTTEEATTRMRVGLNRYLSYNGVDRQKYNETITQFWIKLVRSLLDRADRSRPLRDLINEILSACADQGMIWRYYSKESLATDEARNGWIDPDIKALDF